MYHETVQYDGDGVPPTGNIIHDTKLLIRDLQELAKKEHVTLNQAVRIYKCKVMEYQARMTYQCADSEQRISNSISEKD